MVDTVISVKNVSKAYRLWNDPAARFKAPMWDVLGHFLPGRPAARCFEKAAGYFRDFYALKDISFEVKKGESVGIIGRNGSGKSTLLQIIAGTLQPTSGSVEVRGRVAALLELGSGFNPEFTGRENVYMNAAILGLTSDETDARFDAIASFADIGQFLDQPVKTYSSGMMVRLAFAVQTAVQPDILIVDEALSVGDEAFQRKCFSRLEALQNASTTLLFVSHSAQQVVELCNRAFLLHEGTSIAGGIPKHVVAIYHKLLYGPVVPLEVLRAEHTSLEQFDTGTVSCVDSVEAQLAGSETGDTSYLDASLVSQSLVEYTSRGVRIRETRIENAAGQQVNHLTYGREYNYRYRVDVAATASKVSFHCAIKTVSGLELSGYMTHPQFDGIDVVQPGSSFVATFRFTANLTPGMYFFNAGVYGRAGDTYGYLHRLVDVVAFRVQPFVQLKSTSHVNLFTSASFSAVKDAPAR